MQIKLSTYGNVIATDEKSQEVYSKILVALQRNEKVEINAEGVTISTKSARIIFGKLYKQFKEKFSELISFTEASSLFLFSVNEGISTEMAN